nr:hypothetical protein HmN_000868100 [Hymenolepis microstoma]
MRGRPKSTKASVAFMLCGVMNKNKENEVPNVTTGIQKEGTDVNDEVSELKRRKKGKFPKRRSSKSKGKDFQILNSAECSIKKTTQNTISECSIALTSDSISDQSKTPGSSELQSTPEMIAKPKVSNVTRKEGDKRLNVSTAKTKTNSSKTRMQKAKKLAPPTSEMTDLSNVRMTRSAAKKLSNLTNEQSRNAENEVMGEVILNPDQSCANLKVKSGEAKVRSSSSTQIEDSLSPQQEKVESTEEKKESLKKHIGYSNVINAAMDFPENGPSLSPKEHENSNFESSKIYTAPTSEKEADFYHKFQKSVARPYCEVNNANMGEPMNLKSLEHPGTCS